MHTILGKNVYTDACTAIVDQGEDNSFTYAQFDACARQTADIIRELAGK